MVNVEDIQPGDRVLSQDVASGALAYQLVLQCTERPPSELLQITLAGTTIDTTKGHPFWVNGVGWRMAKRLEVGQYLHSVHGIQRVDGIEDGGTAAAHNLVVAGFNNYFVGDAGVLVHDNTYRTPNKVLTPGLARD